MVLTKPNQKLRRDLKEVAALIKWSGVDPMQMTARMSETGLKSEAWELIKVSASFQMGHAEKVKAGVITWAKAE
ncbi:hypothetical protein [Pseudomonas sp. MWU12-2345]|uniref:hypothetical protein n=1 Tax=Pseudomonas sp. MWU12-2345 TaxID=2928689 RepID=UPI00200C034B|nr:hypothetical protein [Pseudomonas sp. MWU12-2345]